MTNNLQKAQNHINDLVKQDQLETGQVEDYYQRALNAIKQILRSFYNQYADEDKLTLNKLSMKVNKWDLDQFKQTIDGLMQGVTSDKELKKRLKVANAKTKNDKRDLINAVVLASMAIATSQTQKYSNQQLINQYIDEYNYRSDDDIDEDDIDKEIKEQRDFNDRVNNNGDLISMMVTTTITKALSAGLTLGLLNKLLKKSDDSSKKNNIDSSARAGISGNKQLLRISSIFNNNKARLEVFKQQANVKYVVWLTEHDDRVCWQCRPLDNKIFSLKTYPVPQMDTHYGCRCGIEPCDLQGNIITFKRLD